MRKKFFCCLIIYLFVQVETLWISENFWTIVDHGGNLRNGRTLNDFIRFKGPKVNEFVAYWIINRDDKQFEAYGEAYIKSGTNSDNRICARFIDDNDLPTEICGGFRVLSKEINDNSNPFEWYSIRDVPVDRAVEYVHHQIAQVWHDSRRQSVFGGAHINRGLAYAVNLNGSSLHIIRDSDPYFYESNVELLVVRDGHTPKLIAQAGKKRCRHRHGPIVTPDDLTPFNINDPNVQNLSPPHYPARPYNPNNECQNTLYDLNKDGVVDTYELERCLERHDPSRRRNIRSLQLRKKRKQQQQFKEEKEVKTNEANESVEEML